MAKQDDWIRITLRIPPELHAKLTEAALASSMNAEIIGRLSASFQQTPGAMVATETGQDGFSGHGFGGLGGTGAMPLKTLLGLTAEDIKRMTEALKENTEVIKGLLGKTDDDD